ncbi:PTS system IIA component (Fru family) [Streptomyces sp. SLBN-118]|uniref:PTS sugar transporter subunit IIA n=1 Tax=Streptomyces sp. SLBN-118 TaxID=2768454 RepID=UPI00115132B8|nr:PTS sugar transporter subunit IIA [Streptomyces sp. SLBN-118]TQK42460.1 PTS system IIA component (Fru family) [Streptomyces sp. SLBN-118]
MPDVLPREGIRLGLSADNRWDAVRQCGAVLEELGAVEEGYARTMLEREQSISTYVGEGVAIPHGTDASRALVRRTTLAVLQFPIGVSWDGERVTTCVAIAAKGDEHVAVLSSLAQILLEPDQAEKLRSSSDPNEIHHLLQSISKDIQE